MKANQKKINGIYGHSLFILIFLFAQGIVVYEYNEKDLKPSDLILFKGEITNFHVEKIGDKEREIAIIKLHNEEITFKTPSSLYKIVNSSAFNEEIIVGNEVLLGTTKKALAKGKNPSYLKRLFNDLEEGRTYAPIYHLKHQERQLIDFQKYIRVDDQRKEDNMVYGTLMVFIMIVTSGFSIRKRWKTRFEY